MERRDEFRNKKLSVSPIIKPSLLPLKEIELIFFLKWDQFDKIPLDWQKLYWAHHQQQHHNLLWESSKNLYKRFSPVVTSSLQFSFAIRSAVEWFPKQLLISTFIFSKLIQITVCDEAEEALLVICLRTNTESNTAGSSSVVFTFVEEWMKIRFEIETKQVVSKAHPLG